MKRHTSIAFLLAAGLPLLAACGGGDEAVASPATVTVTKEAPAPAPAPVPTTVSPTTPAEAPVAPATTAAVVDFPMPDMTGQVLQDAQDAMQTLGVMYSTSHDALGSRMQVLDRDWLVCDQNIPAGQQVTGEVEGQIDFGVVKLSESCP
ncbi:hypothetical protein [Modestobacter sp. VKM Ac-2985]|uniref:hypothetical protein n=1 Tax=Modestobacter sp. VKM Ac-2985 TaxID=3004139 RepID=UPI0022ABB901|nr:hypothetical protein [Modestobacter sp. VKM Ac-2985]MCZ2839935.1 hypothetical protein [Modestobacter sp. VKM Ac-2985]